MLTLEMPPQLTYLPAALALVDSLGSEPLPPARLHALKAALSECLQNATAQENSVPLRIVLRPSESALEVRVEQHEVEEDLRVWTYTREGVDELCFENLGKRGKLWRLSQFAGPPEASHPQRPSGNLQARLFQPGDAEGIASCAAVAYGHRYHDFVYDPSRIRALAAEGALEPVVAVDADGCVWGHAALRLESAQLAEACAAFVHPAARGSSALRDISELAIKRAHERGLEGLYTAAIASVPASQAAAHRTGFIDVGLRLNALVNDSLVVAYRSVKPRPPHKLYLPVDYAELLTTLYSRLNLAWESGPAPAAPAPGPTLWASAYHPAHSSITVRLRQAGREFPELLDELTEQWLEGGLRSVELRVNLEAPSCSWAVPRLRNAGFVLSALLPGGLEGRDALLLQWQPTRPELGPLNLVSAEARLALAWIERELV